MKVALLFLCMTNVVIGREADLVVNDLGCWRDTAERAVPDKDNYLGGGYTARADAIQKCAKFAHRMGYDVFAVQNGGWCATGPEARETYQKYGPSTACASDGEGGPWANQVYEINIVYKVDLDDLGCWLDTSDRAVPDQDSHLGGGYTQRQEAIQKCALFAYRKGYHVFAIQNGGWCATGPDAEETYQKYGPSSHCKSDGEGGPWANQVYKINKVQQVFINDLGCWRDTADRAVPDHDADLGGDYTRREYPVKKCARLTDDKGYDVFAVQNGGWCATGINARDTYQKYGTSTACHSDGEGGPWGNQVYEINNVYRVVISDLGCWRDTAERAVPDQDASIGGSYVLREDAIQKCAEFAYKRGYDVFVVQNGGWCGTGPEAKETYKKFGSSTACHSDGEGGPWANQVYEINQVYRDGILIHQSH